MELALAGGLDACVWEDETHDQRDGAKCSMVDQVRLGGGVCGSTTCVSPIHEFQDERKMVQDELHSFKRADLCILARPRAWHHTHGVAWEFHAHQYRRQWRPSILRHIPGQDPELRTELRHS